MVINNNNSNKNNTTIHKAQKHGYSQYLGYVSTSHMKQILQLLFYFRILIVKCMRWIHSCLRVCRIASIVSTVYCLTPETLHTLRGEETTLMNFHIIITAGLGVPLLTGPSTILFDACFFILY